MPHEGNFIRRQMLHPENSTPSAAGQQLSADLYAVNNMQNNNQYSEFGWMMNGYDEMSKLFHFPLDHSLFSILK